MGRLKSFENKNRYQSAIKIYKQRKKYWRQVYGVIPGQKAPEVYNNRVRLIDRKLKIWRQAIRRIEKHEFKIKELDKLMIEFLGVSVRSSSKSRKKEYNIARAIFYRHGLEIGISCRYLAEYTGKKFHNHIAVSRKTFIRSCTTNIYNREMWYRWKQFISSEGLQQAA